MAAAQSVRVALAPEAAPAAPDGQPLVEARRGLREPLPPSAQSRGRERGQVPAQSASFATAQVTNLGPFVSQICDLLVLLAELFQCLLV